jgi:SynChlorMet cassette protein ScmC
MKVIGNSRCIRLADGQAWQITAVDGAAFLAEKMARMMMLDDCGSDELARIVFFPGEPDREKSHMIDLILDKEDQLAQPDDWVSRRMGYTRLWQNPGMRDSFYEVDRFGGETYDTYRILYSLYPVYTGAIGYGGLPVHASLIERDGSACLLLAKSGTGKSTCCRRIPPPWHALSDEEALIVATDSGYHVHSFPTWSDFIERNLNPSWDVQRHLPLAGLFFLEQSERDEAIRVGGGEAAISLFDFSLQIYGRYFEEMAADSIRESRKRLFTNACGVTSVVPAFKLRVSLEGKFWEKMEAAMVGSGLA